MQPSSHVNTGCECHSLFPATNALTWKLVFSSQIWKIRSNAAPFTLDVGDEGVMVLAAARAATATTGSAMPTAHAAAHVRLAKATRDNIVASGNALAVPQQSCWIVAEAKIGCNALIHRLKSGSSASAAKILSIE